MGIKNLEKYTARVLSLIQSAKRDYVIFCGRIFNEVLSPYIVDQRAFKFKLKKNDGDDTKNYFELINVKLKLGEVTVEGAIAPQFAKQGYPVGRYGEQIKNLYGKF